MLPICDRREILRGAVLLTIGGLTGCATKPAPLDKTAAASIRRVVLIGPQEPLRYMAIGSGVVIGLALGTVAGGAIGGAVAGATAQYSDFNGAMQSVDLQIGREMRAALAQALANDGYDVVEKIVPRYGANLLSSYDEVDVDSDAICDAFVIAAYAGQGLFSDAPNAYAPFVKVEARLVDAKTHKTLFFKSYGYSPMSPTAPSDPRYTFKDGKDLMSQPLLAAEGLRAGVPLIAALIERDLSKQ